MNFILGGYLESALIRSVDAVNIPERNSSGHPYYMCLNRRVPKAFFDRTATFIALASQTIVPSADWNLDHDEEAPLGAARLGIALNGPEEFGGREWDPDTRAFAKILIDQNALTLESRAHVSAIELDRIVFDEGVDRLAVETELRRTIAVHYLCRLFLQIRASGASKAFLVLGEPDFAVLREVGQFVLRTGMPTPYDLPDLTSSVVKSDEFAAGLLNFSPPDALAVSAVRRDPVVRSYAKRISTHLHELNGLDAQRSLLNAMKEAHAQTIANQQVDKAFEIASWVVKPLHYVPGLDAALSLAEDAADLYSKWTERQIEDTEWYLLGAKMTDVAIKDYLTRKDNL